MSLVERKERTRIKLGEEAARLFLTRGFDATTIDDITAAAHVSPRTFFRYFASKEEVVMSYLWLQVDHLLEALDHRPIAEPFIDAFGAALIESIAQTDQELGKALLRLMRATPSLRARWLIMGWETAERFRGVIALRFRLPADSLPVALAANTLFAATETVLDYLCDTEDDFVESMLTALRMLDSGGIFNYLPVQQPLPPLNT
ncbi:MAG: TetR family transcriptional regulator [Ferrimicrobium sp.]